MRRNKRLEKQRGLEKLREDFLGGSALKNLPANTTDTGLIPDRERVYVQSN